MEKELGISKGLNLINRSTFAMLGSNGEEGYPNIKAMYRMENNGINEIWFSTNTSSKRVCQLLNNPKACVYFADLENFEGLMLVGKIEVLQDDKSRKRLWRDGCEKYYPLGVKDPDYSVLRFTAHKGNYYHGLENVDFKL
ncbi:UNVERIFIED_CONTAM: general stress protein 26 [Acetivibrio alkalicellulosi]